MTLSVICHMVFSFFIDAMKMPAYHAVIACTLALSVAVSFAIDVPAFTAYALPNPDALEISQRDGIIRWDDPATTIHWYGKFSKTGSVKLGLVTRLNKDAVSKLRMSLGKQARVITIKGTGSPLIIDFGDFSIASAGYQDFTLTSLNSEGVSAGDITALVIDGPAADTAHFNLKERRNAASIHLGYPLPKDVKVAGFYKEVTGITDPTATFYMACGFHRGYFGMQVNSATERRIIFSVWDSGGEAIDRDKVQAADRVTLVAKGENVYTGDFGNEGTGGHSHLKYLWKTGEKQRFYLTAKPVDGTHTIFAGYYFHPDQKKWNLIASWKAPREGGWLRGLHGFSENFSGSSGHLIRRSLHANEWICTDEGEWIEQTRATFTHDETGNGDRFDRFMGVENGSFFLNQGGFVEGFTNYGAEFERPARGKAPDDIVLPLLLEK